MSSRRLFMCAAALGAAFIMAQSYCTGAFADEKPAAPDNAAVEIRPRIGGYIEAWYRSDNSNLSSQTAAAKKADNEFRVRRARLTASGDATDEISYKLTASLDGPSPASSAATVKLWDAYLAYKANELATITAGQFKYDFTLEGLESTPDRVPILRAESINDIAGKLGTKGGSFRDTGVKVNGGYGKLMGLSYGLDYINGSGINTGDNNARKDVVARAAIAPLAGLTLGASWYRGTAQDETEQRFVINESAYGFDAQYLYGGARLRAEYTAGKWENWDAVSSTGVLGKTQRPNGWYLQASYKLPQAPKLEVLGRFEDYDRDESASGSHLKTTTLGATYYLKGKTRISADYLIRRAGNNPAVIAQETDATGSNIHNLFLVQALVVF